MTEGYIIDIVYGSEAYYSLAAILWTLVSALTADRLEMTLVDSHAIKVVYSAYFLSNLFSIRRSRVCRTLVL
jgi:hypothetical protein